MMTGIEYITLWATIAIAIGIWGVVYQLQLINIILRDK